MNAATATLPEQVELSVTRLAHVLFRGAGPGLSRSAASALHRIATAGPQRITELAAYESIAQPSATTLVGRLEGQGLVTRGPDPDDGRAVLVSITPAGQKLLDERRRTRAATLGAEIDALDPEERETLSDAVPILERLAEAIA